MASNAAISRHTVILQRLLSLLMNTAATSTSLSLIAAAPRYPLSAARSSAAHKPRPVAPPFAGRIALWC